MKELYLFAAHLSLCGAQTQDICQVINSPTFGPMNAAPVSKHKWDLSKTAGTSRSTSVNVSSNLAVTEISLPTVCPDLAAKTSAFGVFRNVRLL